MSGNVKYSEAAVLYAENAELIETMRKRFQNDVDANLNELRDVLRNTLPEPFQEKLTSTNRYWWMGDESKDRDLSAHFYFSFNNPRLVYPGEITLFIVAPKADEDKLRRYAAVAKQPELAKYCTLGSGGSWSLFSMKVKMQNGDNIEKTAEPIAGLLLALSEVE